MKKKIISIICTVMLLAGNVAFAGNEVFAREENLDVDSIELAQGDESIGYIQIMPRGMYLQSGFSEISDAGNGKITAGGATMAQMEVENLSICVEVQKMTGGHWATYKMWTVEKKNESVILTSKTFEVEPGLYKVTCIHGANSDSSSSFTNGLYIS